MDVKCSKLQDGGNYSHRAKSSHNCKSDNLPPQSIRIPPTIQTLKSLQTVQQYHRKMITVLIDYCHHRIKNHRTMVESNRNICCGHFSIEKIATLLQIITLAEGHAMQRGVCRSTQIYIPIEPSIRQLEIYEESKNATRHKIISLVANRQQTPRLKRGQSTALQQLKMDKSKINLFTNKRRVTVIVDREYKV